MWILFLCFIQYNNSSIIAINEDIDQVAIKPARAPYFIPLNVTITSFLFFMMESILNTFLLHHNLFNANLERNKVENLLAFAPNYVNVLEVNLELIKQYPEIYSEFLTQKEQQILFRGEQS
jgi:hypothetical protein